MAIYRRVFTLRRSNITDLLQLPREHKKFGRNKAGIWQKVAFGEQTL